MKTTILFAAAALALLASCKSPETRGAPSTVATVKKAWHCPMHPQIVKDHEGHCPICGMELVPFDDGAADTAEAAGPSATADGMDQAKKPAGKTVRIEPSVLQKIGVRTEMVDAGTLGREILADAEGVLDDAAEVSVTVRAMGYLQETTGLREGDRVKRGQILAKFYSPELVAAQGDWLAARPTGDSAAAAAARERLESLGFPEASFAQLAKSGRAVRDIPLAAPVSGWVRARGATTGQAVMAGAELFRLVEGEGALLEARLPVSDAALVGIGDRAEITGDGLAKTTAKVVAVVPSIDRSARSATLRLAAAKGSGIRVGGLYQARFQAKKETGFVVPQDAVLHSGRRDIVFVALEGGKFQPVEVEVGPTSDGRTLVRSGVEAGDEVVVSAQFLLDGESRLQSALDQLDEGAKSPAPHGSEARP